MTGYTVDDAEAIQEAMLRATQEAATDRAREAVEDSTWRLLIAFRRFCVRELGRALSEDDLRLILDEAATLDAGGKA